MNSKYSHSPVGIKIINHSPLTIDVTKDRYQSRYRLGLNSIFVPHSSPFSKYLQLYLSHMFNYTCIYIYLRSYTIIENM